MVKISFAFRNITFVHQSLNIILFSFIVILIYTAHCIHFSLFIDKISEELQIRHVKIVLNVTIKK